jgi:hypothetical protein
MLKFTGQRRGRVFVGLGLSDLNLRRLRADQPIVVDLVALGLPGPPQEVLLFAGPTEEAMVAHLRAAGFDLPAPKPDPDPSD